MKKRRYEISIAKERDWRDSRSFSRRSGFFRDLRFNMQQDLILSAPLKPQLRYPPARDNLQMLIPVSLVACLRHKGIRTNNIVKK